MQHRSHLSLLAAGVIALPVRATDAQDAARAPLASDVRVRVTAPGLHRKPIVGRLVRADRDTIALAAGALAPLVSIPVAAVTRLEVSQGRRAGAGARRGAAMTALVVGAAGATLTTIVAVDAAIERARPGRCGESGCYYGQTVVAVLSVVATAAGAAGGALVGALVGAEGWERVSVPPRVGLAPLPTGRGLAVRLAF
jgi:hypothetical protein